MLHTAAGHHDGWVCGYTLGDMPGAAVERSYCFQVSAASQCHDMYIIEHVLVARRCYRWAFRFRIGQGVAVTICCDCTQAFRGGSVTALVATAWGDLWAANSRGSIRCAAR